MDKEKKAFLEKQKHLAGIAAKINRMLMDEVEDFNDGMDVIIDVLSAMIYSLTPRQEDRLNVADLVYKDMVSTLELLHEKDIENTVGHD